MKVYLVRHGEAEPEPGEFERVLTENGRAGIRRLAAFLGAREAHPVEIRHSTETRARQTAELIAKELGSGISVREVRGLAPSDGVTDLEEFLRDHHEDLLLVGHLPHLDRLASRLLSGEEEASFDMPPGSAMCLERRNGFETGRRRPLRFRMMWMVSPRLLPEQAG